MDWVMKHNRPNDTSDGTEEIVQFFQGILRSSGAAGVKSKEFTIHQDCWDSNRDPMIDQ
uniref:Uncharacterized protein n=1 Tax=Nannospalax galili TaxID=1026970 RepID=A0A8C6RXY8_NANGA